MKSSKLRLLMLTLIAAGPLASAPALAAGDQGGLLNFWSQLIQWLQGSHGSSGTSGGGTSLPGPGALGLVVIGLGTGMVVARRRKK
jgi:hypothetical protein